MRVKGSNCRPKGIQMAKMEDSKGGDVHFISSFTSLLLSHLSLTPFSLVTHFYIEVSTVRSIRGQGKSFGIFGIFGDISIFQYFPRYLNWVEQVDTP